MISFYQQDVAPGELLYSDDFSSEAAFKSNWHVTGGEWYVKDGALYGLYRGNGGGLIFTNEQFPGDVMLDYYGTMIAPCNNDLNFLFRSNGKHNPDEEDTHLKGYVGGLNGWWLNHAGIEREPGCDMAMVVNFTAQSDVEYHIQTGIVGSTVFLAVDDKLLFALNDPAPTNEPGCDYVGLGTYCSQIKVRDFRVYRPVVTEVFRSYTPNF